MHHTEARRILGVDKSASKDDIKQAYRRLSMKHHPDREGGDAEKFKQINAAYETLQKPETKYSSFKDAFEDVFGEDLYRKSKELTTRVQFYCTLEEAFNGCTKNVSFDHIGAGTRTIEVPSGALDDQIVHTFEHNGINVLVYVRISVPEGMTVDWGKGGTSGIGNITLETKVSPFKLIKGGHENVVLFDGTKVRVYIPPRTQANTLLKIKEKGYWRFRKYHVRGDCLLRVIPDIKHIVAYPEEEIIDVISTYLSALKGLPVDEYIKRVDTIINSMKAAVELKPQSSESNEETNS